MKTKVYSCLSIVQWCVSAVVLLSTTGCSTEIKVTEISSIPANDAGGEGGGEDVGRGQEIDGIPFRIRNRYVATLYKNFGDEYREVARESITLARHDRLYALNFFGMPFADVTFVVNHDVDGTLKDINLTDSSKIDDAITAAATQANAVSSTIAQAEAARVQQAEAAAQTSRTELAAREDAIVAMRQAVLAVEAALDQLAQAVQKVPFDAFAVSAAQRAVTSAKISANLAARRADLPQPYPEEAIEFNATG